MEIVTTKKTEIYKGNVDVRSDEVEKAQDKKYILKVKYVGKEEKYKGQYMLFTPGELDTKCLYKQFQKSLYGTENDYYLHGYHWEPYQEYKQSNLFKPE